MVTSVDTVSVWAPQLKRGADVSRPVDLDGTWGWGPALEGFWRDVFSVARPGARVLQIGGGAGEVAVWAAEAGRDLKVKAGVRAEAMAAKSGAYDMVISNFAIEYADRDAAIGELERVMAPGGCTVMALHSADSVVTGSNRRTLQTHAWLTEAAALRADHLSRRKLLKDVLKLRHEFPAAPGQPEAAWFDIAERLLRNEPGARQALAEADEAAAARLQMCRDQVRVALDKTGLARMESRMMSRGLGVFTSELTGVGEAGAAQKVAWIASVTKGAP